MIDYEAVIAAETERFIGAIERSDPSRAVPTCPDWTSDDLLWHLTEVHAFWTRILRDRVQTDAETEAAEASKPPRPDGRAETIALLRDETEALLGELRGREDDEPAWFWLATAKTVGSTRRMQAHEATMHRVDAELVAGLDSAPLDAELAADGVAHALEVMFAWWGTLPGFEFRPAGGAVELAAPDLGRSWLVQPGRWVGVGESGTSYDEPGVVVAGEAEAAASITGTAEALDRWLWGRGPEPSASGDAGSLDGVRAVQAEGMQ